MVSPASELSEVAERREMRWQAYQRLRPKYVARGDTKGVVALDYIMRKEVRRRKAGDAGSAE